MSKIKVLVVENEIIIADNICDTINDLGFIALEPAMNYTEAISLIEKEKPDIAILDIQLSGKKTGIDLAEKINKDYDFPFVFLTSNADKVTFNDAKKVMPSAFLVKPFAREELYITIEITLNNFFNKSQSVNNDNQIKEESLFVKDKGTIIKLPFNEILYLKSSHVYLEIVLKNKKVHVVRGSLNDIIKKLNNKFIQVHRSYIVNIHFLNQIENTSLLIFDEEIPIGKKYKEVFLEKLNINGTPI